MRAVPHWIEYFFGLAHHVSTRSKDPRTNVGAVFVAQDKRILSLGYNGFPAGIRETETRWLPENKENFVVHAEANAILNASCSLQGSTCFVTLAPCIQCALKLASVGTSAVYTPKLAIDARLEARPELRDSHNLMKQILSEASVGYHEV